MITDDERREVARKLRGDPCDTLIPHRAGIHMGIDRAERTCRLEYDTVHHDYVCTVCGELYDSGLYTAVSGNDKYLLKPMKFCPNCGARVMEVDE